METPDDPPSTGNHPTAGYGGPADAKALGDIAAGRLIDSDAVVHWLGGWHLARADDAPIVSGYSNPITGTDPVVSSDRMIGDIAPSSAMMPPQSRPAYARSDDNVTTPLPSLAWTETAIGECDRLRRSVARLGRGSEDRLAAGLVGAMVRLIVDGPDCRNGVFDVALLPTLSLRIANVDGKMIVIGPRSTGAIL